VVHLVALFQARKIAMVSSTDGCDTMTAGTFASRGILFDVLSIFVEGRRADAS